MFLVLLTYSSYKPQKISPKFQGTVRQLLHKKIRDSYIHPQFVTDVMKPMSIEQYVPMSLGPLCYLMYLESWITVYKRCLVVNCSVSRLFLRLVLQLTSIWYQYYSSVWHLLIMLRSMNQVRTWTLSSVSLLQRSSSASSCIRRRQLSS